MKNNMFEQPAFNKIPELKSEGTINYQEIPESREDYKIWLQNKREELLNKEAENDHVKESEVAGLGLFAKRDFHTGDLISEYLIDRYENFPNAEKVEEDPNLSESAIQIGVDNEGKGLYVGVPMDHPRKFVNHSCNPNAGIRIIDLPDGTKNSLLLAIKEIEKDREITIDYATVQFEKWDLEGCRCGELNCRGKMTEFARLPDNLKKKYIDLGLIPDYALKLLEAEKE